MAFIAAYVDRVSVEGLRWGVQPICRVLTEHGCKIAPSTYYAFTTGARSARSVCDEARLVQVRRVFAACGKRYGADKVWWQLHKEGSVVARCTVKRLMKGAGLQGVVRRHGHIRTTTADPDAVRAPDLVKRNFTASRPNELWVVDFTYVHTFIGFVFTAFVTDVFSRRLVGWRTFSSMPTELPLDALEMAVWIRAGHDLTGLVHHSDAGSTPRSGTPTASPSWGYWPPSGASGTASTTLLPRAR